MEVKLSDFSLLTDVKKKDNLKIPGGTPGYVTPEYYNKEPISIEDAKKQDYFALGSTLFYIKYGEQMLKYKKLDDNLMTCLNVIFKLQYKISYLYESQTTEQDFIDFIRLLISYISNERPNIEQIYRDKWLNDNSDIINKIIKLNENDEEKAIMEFQKSDFLIKMDKNSKEKQKKFRFKRKE